MPPVHYHAGRFPPRNLDWTALIPLLGPATAAVARYDGMLAAAPNSTVLPMALLREREAVMSSRIEGTRATVDDLLLFQVGQSADERRDDVMEVVNYRKAMQRAEEMLQKLPLCLRVVRNAHRVLMSGARGANRAPGEYRRAQNWIGPPNCKIEEAKFVPIAVDKLPDGMGAWEKHIHADTENLLVQAAVLHAEFEALHPFMDGNGRIGRMLIPLFLWRRGLIRRPVFYISARFEANRDAYYERLLAVSRDGDWTGWCRFFLEAVRAQAEKDLAKAEGIFALYEKMKRRIPETTRSQYAVRGLDWIFQRPIFRVSDFAANAGIPEATAHRFIGALTKGEILAIRLPSSGRRSAILAFPELLRIAED